MAKLVAIGDSLTQGFQHGAISRPQWSYPTMVACALGAPVFRLPHFGPRDLGGLPLNVEVLARKLERRFGKRVSWWQAPFAAATAYALGWRVANWWQEGPGRGPSATGPLHHNLAVWGFEVADSYRVDPAKCAQNLSPPWTPSLLPLPSEPMYRTAMRVLNPRQLAAYDEMTQLDCLGQIARTQGAVENLILCLGGNNVLGSVIQLATTPSIPAECNLLPHERKAVVWRPQDFAVCYAHLAARIRQLQDKGLVCQVLVGTVPDVTILPVCRGVNRKNSPLGSGPDQNGLYDFYTHFWIWDDDFQENPSAFPHLTRWDVQALQNTVRQYNATIKWHALLNGWHVVDVHALMGQLRYRSTGGNPTYVFPPGLLAALAANPSTNYLADATVATTLGKSVAQPIDARFLWLQGGQIRKGGLFSLDGIHPTTVAHGIVADAFLQVMATVPGVGPIAPLGWGQIVANDPLITDPPAVLDNLQDWLGWVEHQGLVRAAIALVGG